MSSLRRFLDSLHPKFSKDGKLARFYPVYEAIDTFLYTPSDVTDGPAHVRDAIDLKRMMIMVVVALIPCILMAMYNTGYQVNLAYSHVGVESVEGWRGAVLGSLGLGLNPNNVISCFVHGALYFVPVFLVCNIVGGFFEVVFSIIRRHDVNEGFLVTGMLFPLICPPSVPLWQVAMGIAFAVIIGKEVFGGTGKNFLNPALVARAFLFFAYPAEWSGDDVWVAADGVTSPTPLGVMATQEEPFVGMAAVTDGLNLSWTEAFIGMMPGSMGETSALACLLGAILLIATGIGSWRIMLSTLIGAMATAALLHQVGSENNPAFMIPPHWHLVIGGFAFGVVFMATDPVSATMTRTGHWFYGLLIGFMTIVIRVLNPAYAEGIMLAILFGNVFAPLIDYCVIQANIRRRLVRNAA